MSQRVVAGLCIIASLLLLCQVALAEETIKVVVLDVTANSGMDEEDLAYLKDVVNEAGVTSGGAAIISSSGFKSQRECNDSCAFKAAKKAGASHVILYAITRRKDIYVLTVKLYNVAEAALVAMDRSHAETLEELERELARGVGDVMRYFGGSPEQSQSPKGDADAIATRTPATGQSGPYYGDVKVEVTGAKELTGEPCPAVAEVYVNGRFVSQTPYMDGFPNGNYEIRLEAYGKTYKKAIHVAPGSANEVSESVTVPLSEEERIEVMRREDEKRAARFQANVESWQEAYDHWKSESDEIDRKRRPMAIAGAVLLPSSVGMLIAGFVFVAKSKDQEEEYNIYRNDYLNATDQADIDYYRESMINTDEARKVNTALGATFLSLGAAAFVTGIVLLARLPKKKASIKVPADVYNHLDISVAPLLGPGHAGIGLSGRF